MVFLLEWLKGGLRWTSGFFFALAGVAVAQLPTEPLPDEGEAAPLESSWETQRDARTLLLMVPGPRGQITDRHGTPLALNRVQYAFALNFPYFEGGDEGQVLRFAQERIDLANRTLGKSWSVEPEVIIRHYENRRWLPLTFTGSLTDEELVKAETIQSEGLVLNPTYERLYSRGAFAPHVLGYVGKVRKLPTGAIENGEPLFSDVEGRDGLEKSFNEQLTGKPGRINVLYDASGNKLTHEMVQRPIPGNNLVTTLDAEMQATAERILSEKAKRGAFVFIDIHSGEILALASWPVFDPNDWIPFLPTETFKALQEDPDIPLFSRSFRAAYPPASTFKIPVAMAALESGAIDENSYFGCPTSLYIGDRYFHNWNKSGEAPMNVMQAIKRSCNTFFYRVGIATGSGPIYTVSTRLGLGRPTGIPLSAEEDGFIPNDEWSMGRYNTRMTSGNIANMSIGQGDVLASPLQIAKMMAAVAHGGTPPKLRLVKQVQDLNNAIVEAFPMERDMPIGVGEYARSLTIEGMKGVVLEGDGTGKAARHEHMEVAGKTGTGQWGPVSEDKRVAWFAGFCPADHPRYAFAALYEGDPGERLGGGANAAPIVGAFLKEIFSEDRVEQVLAETIVMEGGVAPSAIDVATGPDGAPIVARAEPMVPDRVGPPPSPNLVPGGPAPQPVARPAQPEEESGGRIIRWWKKMRGR
ncbi:MAG: penicillin-binding transpeptidase domain-containing protein [Verrucomicrobiota bacterium]